VQYATLLWRQDDCAHVVFQSGRCPRRGDDIALPVNAAGALKARLGGSIVARQLEQPDFGLPPELGHATAGKPPRDEAGTRALHEKVVGLFTVPAGQPYWFGVNIGAPILNAAGGQTSQAYALVPRNRIADLPLPYEANITVDQPLDWSHATSADVVRVQQALTALRVGVADPNISVLTGVSAMLAANAKDRSQLNRTIDAAQVQLLLLAGLVLIAVIVVGAQRRRTEVIIAALRGRRSVTSALLLMIEPLVMVTLGVLPGLYLGHQLVRLGAHMWLLPGTPVHITSASVVTTLALAGASVLVAAVFGWLAASRPLVDQLTESAGTLGTGGGSVELIVVTLAAAGFVDLAFVNSPQSSTLWSLLAPAMLGLAAGLLLGRLVRVLLRPAVRATSESPNVSGFLALRELVRDRAAWRVTAVVTLGLSLLAFTATVNRGAASDRLDRAGLIVGAPTVVDVHAPSSDALVQAVKTVDPHGKWAMAAELLEPPGGPEQRTLAIDTTRLHSVAGWTRPIDGYTPGRLKKLLHVPARFRGGSLPVLTAGAVQGLTFGLGNSPVSSVDAHPTSVLPELLTQGSLADLSSLNAAQAPVPIANLGTATLIQQVWVGSHAPANALERLKATGLTVTNISRRSQVATTLERRGSTAGLLAFAAAAIFAALFAIALLVGNSVAGLSQQRIEMSALFISGVTGLMVLKARTSAFAIRLVLAAVIGVASGVAAAHLAAQQIPSATTGGAPLPQLPLPSLPAVISVAATLVVAFLAMAPFTIVSARRHGSIA
jgi:hypothetical protein